MHDEPASSSVSDQVAPPDEDMRSPTFANASTQLRSLDDFEIIREIGRGGTAIVYEAFQKSLRRRVALKQLPAAAALDPRWRERFHNEVRATSRLSHSNIVPFYELGRDDGSPFYTMQLIDGISLAEVIRCLRQCCEGYQPCITLASDSAHPAFFRLCERCQCRFACCDETRAPNSGKRDEVEPTTSIPYQRIAVELIRDAARAVDYAHRRGILHLDIKPSNLLIDRQGKLWITDFGAARFSDVPAGARNRSGTLCYMSPEQAMGRDELLDARGDVYSLGATLYELLTLEPPSFHVRPHAFLPHLSLGGHAFSREVYRKMPRQLDAIITKAVAPERERRYPTANELAVDLQSFLDSIEHDSRDSVTDSRGAVRRLWPMFAAALMCVALASVVFLPGHAAPYTNVVREGLVGYWAAEGDARDSSGQCVPRSQS